jgi:isopenicillin N synthase-like dioxygenase
MRKCEEIRESYNVHFNCSDESYPVGAAEQMRSLYNDFHGLTLDLLSVLSTELYPDTPAALLNVHQQIGTKQNTSLMRMLHYPPLPENIHAGTERLGEHSDYGTLTLLFQDEIGGLEVYSVICKI